MKKIWLVIFYGLSLLYIQDIFAETSKLDYGLTNNRSITVEPGTHSFQVDGIAFRKNTNWYVNGIYTGSDEDDWSGWTADDPEYTRYLSDGTIIIQAEVFDRFWIYEERHTWYVTVQIPKEDTRIYSMDTDPNTFIQYKSGTLIARLTKDNWPICNDLSNKKVYFYVGGEQIGNYVYTDSDGFARKSYSPDSSGSKTFRAVFDGDSSYNSCEDSDTFSVTPETVDVPGRPSSISEGVTETSIYFSTSGADINTDHTLEYRFDWGDGNYSSWSTSKSASHFYSNPGTKYVRVQARCKDHLTTSSWSSDQSLTIYRPKSGEILSVYPSSGSFDGTSQTVTVTVKNKGRDDENLIVEPVMPLGWSVPLLNQWKETIVPYNQTNTSYFTFTVTPPDYNDSATIAWKLYYDEPGTSSNFWLNTFDQSVVNTIPKPDLIVEKIELDPVKTTYYVGDEVQISTQIKNVGAADYPGVININYYLNGNLFDTDNLSNGLGSGTSDPLGEKSDPFNLFGGSNTIKVEVVYNNNIPEISESNNIEEFALYVENVTGGLKATVQNQNAVVIEGATVKLYDDNWNPMGSSYDRTTNSSGEAYWTDLDSKDYHLEAYYNGEYWVNDVINIIPYIQNPIILKRNEPYALDFKVKISNTSENITGETTHVNVPLTYEIHIINESHVARKVKAKLWLNANNYYDEDNETISENGGEHIFLFYHTPTEAGTFNRRLEIETYVNDEYTKTDSWGWSQAYTVIEPQGEITYPAAGENCNLDKTDYIRWTSTGNMGNYVKVELVNFVTGETKVISSQEYNDGEMTWNPKEKFSDLVTGPYYNIRISNIADPNIYIPSKNFGLYTKDYGITVITHGYQPDIEAIDWFDFPVWPQTMASTIIKRAGKGNAFKYNPDTGRWNYLGNYYDPYTNSWKHDNNALIPESANEGEIVLIFDWYNESDIPASGYSEAAGDALFASLKSGRFYYSINDDLEMIDLFWKDEANSIKQKIHFIGHSRGNVVNSMAIRRIAEYMPDFEIEQVTLLDPHPWDGADPGDERFIIDNIVYIWDNTTWADNFFQKSSFPTGTNVEGAINRELTNLDCYFAYTREHSDVHLWYFGTIDLLPQAFNGDKQVPEWYTDRIHEGFYDSRLGGKSNTTCTIGKHDKNDYFIPTIFNNDFDHPGLFGNAPGWSYHGGSGNIVVEFEEGYTSPVTGLTTKSLNNILSLSKYNSYACHNRLYVPKDTINFVFKYKVEEAGGQNGSFTIKFHGSKGTYTWFSPISFTAEKDWTPYSIPISILNGADDVGTIELSLSGENLPTVLIDDLYFIRSGVPEPISPEQGKRIIANLTPEFEWSPYNGEDSQAGYQLRVLCDTEGDVIVYDTGYISDQSRNTHAYNPGHYNGSDSISGCNHISLPLEYGKTYHWHVRYYDSQGNWSPWSADVSGQHRYFYPVAPENNDPVLSSPNVTPATGGTTTDFEFTVTYYDQDNDAPQYVRVNISGMNRYLQLKSGTASNGVYSYTTKLYAGDYRYAFETMDTENGYASTESQSSPYVEALLPSIAKIEYSIDFGTTNQDITFDIWNDGDVTLDYSAIVTEGAEYFSVTPDSGLSDGSTDRQTHTIHVARDSIISGQTVIGKIEISAADADNSPQYINLSVSKSADIVQYTLNASVIGGNGTILPQSGIYDTGAVVILVVNPNLSYGIEQWTGTDFDLSLEKTNTVTMNEDKIVTVQLKLLKDDTIDSDNDGIPNWWEIEQNLNVYDVSDSECDPDNDALINCDEFYYRTNPYLADTDNDGLEDGGEVVWKLDPADNESFLTIIECEKDNSDNLTIIWPYSNKKTYQLFWRSTLDNDTAWDSIDYPGILYDLRDNIDGTRSWKDQGFDSQMLSIKPGKATQRFYKITAKEKFTNQTIPDGMAYIPAGSFVMGNTFGGACENDEYPVHTVYLDSYYIDKYEVTNEEYVNYLNNSLSSGLIEINAGEVYQAGASILYFDYVNNSEINYDGNVFSVASGKGNYPVGYVSWYGANSYAQYVAKRLPTEAEWEKAAGWNSVTENKTRYSFGNTIDSSWCNYNNYYGGTTPVGYFDGTGERKNACSWYGCYDMSGNVWEWCNDWYNSDYYTGSPTNNPQGPDTGTTRVLRSGTYDHNYLGQRITDRITTIPTDMYKSVGFRCAKSAN